MYYKHIDAYFHRLMTSREEICQHRGSGIYFDRRHQHLSVHSLQEKVLRPLMNVYVPVMQMYSVYKCTDYLR